MKRYLILYFESFGGDTVNSGAEAVKYIPSEIDGVEIVCRRIPVSFSRCEGEAKAIVEAVQPDMIFALGQSGNRAAVCLERVALNVKKSEISDNDGIKGDGGEISGDGPVAYITRMPIDTVAQNLRQNGLPVFVSNTAGTFLCNYLYYSLLHNFPSIPALFVHIPLTPAQAATRKISTSSMSSKTASEAFRRVIEYCKESVSYK